MFGITGTACRRARLMAAAVATIINWTAVTAHVRAREDGEVPVAPSACGRDSVLRPAVATTDTVSGGLGAGSGAGTTFSRPAGIRRGRRRSAAGSGSGCAAPRRG
jgi:hypothetical protein